MIYLLTNFTLLVKYWLKPYIFWPSTLYSALTSEESIYTDSTYNNLIPLLAHGMVITEGKRLMNVDSHLVCIYRAPYEEPSLQDAFINIKSPTIPISIIEVGEKYSLRCYCITVGDVMYNGHKSKDTEFFKLF